MYALMAVAFPLWGLPEMFEALPERTRRQKIPPHIHQLVEIQYEPVVALDLTRGTVLHFFDFCFVSAEEMVVNHEYSAVILVDVLRIAAVMYAVIGGGVEGPLNPA